LAMEKDLLLITDDMPTREFGRRFGVRRSSWLQPVFMVANNRKKIDFDTFVRWTAHLVGAGHNFVCVSGNALLHAASIDEQAGQCPGYFFNQIANTIGGSAAEPRSHIRVVLEFLRRVWYGPSAVRYREKTTGLLLEKLIQERTADYRKILRTVSLEVADNMALTRYISDWMRGHFISLDPAGEAGRAPRTDRQKAPRKQKKRSKPG
jgi:hypothetical protein